MSGGPVVQRGETEALIDLTDIFPTLADLAGISVVRKEVTSDSNYRGVAGLYTVVAKQYKVDGHSTVYNQRQ